MVLQGKVGPQADTHARKRAQGGKENQPCKQVAASKPKSKPENKPVANAGPKRDPNLPAARSVVGPRLELSTDLHVRAPAVIPDTQPAQSAVPDQLAVYEIATDITQFLSALRENPQANLVRTGPGRYELLRSNPDMDWVPLHAGALLREVKQAIQHLQAFPFKDRTLGVGWNRYDLASYLYSFERLCNQHPEQALSMLVEAIEHVMATPAQAQAAADRAFSPAPIAQYRLKTDITDFHRALLANADVDLIELGECFALVASKPEAAGPTVDAVDFLEKLVATMRDGENFPFRFQSISTWNAKFAANFTSDYVELFADALAEQPGQWRIMLAEAIRHLMAPAAEQRTCILRDFLPFTEASN